MGTTSQIANKSYSSFMDEIFPEELYNSLIKMGLFSDKLPPVFDGALFLNYCQNPFLNHFKDEKHDYVRYNSMRNINTPRPLSIPTPMGHERLCACLKDNWSRLQKYFRHTTAGQNHIVSRIHIRKMKDSDSLFKMTYKNWRSDGTPEPDLLIGKHYLVSADISQCFPSIYTHAVPWALVGKTEAKKNQNKRDEWYNKIDRFTRLAKNNETHGLSIGPHTSSILSEIILCKIDEHLSGRWDYIRNIDDYSCYVETRDEADCFLVDLDTCLREYGLSLNHKKTGIKELPIATTESWTRQIQHQMLAFGKFHKYIDYKEILSIMDYLIELMEHNENNASILSYGLKYINNLNLPFSKNAQNYYQKTAFSLSLTYPYIVPLLDECVFSRCEIDRATVQTYLEMIIERYFPKKYFEACSFSLFYASKYELEISNFKLDEIIEAKDCILNLSALIYCRTHKRTSELKQLEAAAIQIIDDNELEEFWPFAYECLPAPSLPDEWKEMKDAGVSFLKEEFRL